MLFHRCKHNTVKFEMKIPVNTYTVVCKKKKHFSGGITATNQENKAIQ